MRHALLVLALVIATTAAAQNVRKLTLHFETDKHELTEIHQRQLTNFLSLLPKDMMITFSVYGHTDDVASSAYNEALSLRRGNSVKMFLVSMHVSEERIALSAFGEMKLISDADLETGRTKSRRVEVVASWSLPAETPSTMTITDLYNQLRNEPQEFCIPRDRDTIIATRGGVVFRYTANSVEIPKGQLLCDCLTLRVSEVNRKSDMVTQNTSTSANGQMLITEGMLRVEAEMCGVATKLKPGQSMGVMMPTTQSRDDMFVFFGEDDGTGNLNWDRGENPIAMTPFTGSSLTQPVWTQVDRPYWRCSFFSCKLPRFFGWPGKISTFYLPEWVDVGDSIRRDFEASFGKYNGGMLSAAAKSDMSYYVFSTPGLGWINCDRFSGTPNNQLMSFDVYTPADNIHDVKIVFNDFGSVMGGYRKGDHFVFDNIPRNMTITVVGLRFSEGKPSIALVKTNTSVRKLNELKFEEVRSLEALKERLTVLDRDA